MIVLNKKFNAEKSEEIKETGFCYIYKNYVLRQSINFLTIILIEGLYLLTKVMANSEGSYQTYVYNKLVTEGVPLALICLLLVNMSFNVFCWVWELKS